MFFEECLKIYPHYCIYSDIAGSNSRLCYIEFHKICISDSLETDASVSSRFSSNSEASASEILENVEEMFLR